jgi:hypothetical protein
VEGFILDISMTLIFGFIAIFDIILRQTDSSSPKLLILVYRGFGF